MPGKKILVIRLSSLGDVVLTLPVYRALRQAWPDAHITALVKEEFADVLAGNPDINERLLFRRGDSLSALVRRVRGEHYDVVLDLHSNLRSWAVRVFSGAAQKIRYRKAALARRLFVRWRWPSADLQHHTLDRYFQALRRLDPAQTAFQGAPARSILVIQTAFLGDAVLTTPMLAALHEHDPQLAITVLCTPEVADVFERHPAVAHVLQYDKRRDRSLGRLWQVAGDLRRQRFDAAILPHNSFRSALLARLAGIPRRIGFSRSQGRWLLTDVLPFQWGVHDADRNLSLLGALGIRRSSGILRLHPEPAAEESIRQRLRAAGVRPNDWLLGINAGSVWATKRWLASGFAAVADRVVRELGGKVIFFGGPKDAPAAQEVVSQMREPAINWVGKTSLRELIAAIAQCKAFLTNDSGPMHIAVACQVPTVAIFGPTTRELGFFPYGSGHIVIEKNLPCRPCGLHGAKECPLGHFECMKTITPDEVFAAVSGFFAGEKPLSEVSSR